MAVPEGDEDVLEQLEQHHDALLDLLSRLVSVHHAAVTCTSHGR